MEAAVASFHAVVIFAFRFLAFLAFDGEEVIGYGDVDIVFGDPGKFSSNFVPAFRFSDVYRGYPIGFFRIRSAFLGTESISENSSHLVVKVE